MKMRKLDQILEQCLEDMSINESKFNFDKFNKLCEDAYDDFEDESFVDLSDPEEKLLSDEDIEAQYNDFNVEYCEIEPSEVHDDWFNATLEIEFPNADHPDFNSSVIENAYYDRASDNWGFDNWYPEETLEKLKQIILDKIAEYEKEHENDTYLDNDYNPETEETTFTYKNKKGDVLDSITANRKDLALRTFYNKYHK